ncbi:phage replisome organizer N-terminal domain-containing protein [Liquorilactobacillus hordei]|uniref:phage replisome organizer N-terminal domain-containing protein n=1 Tax=Liquorilactobacillus hordei TaxID=468911 RepID=UPI0039EB4846
MAEKIYYWIKLQMDFFKSPAVKLLRRMSGGDTYALIYLEMILLSLENNGFIYFTGIGKDMADEVSLILDEKKIDVEFLLTFLSAKKLIEYSDPNAFKFSDDVTEGLIGKEVSSAKRVRAWRKRQKALQSNKDVTTSNTEKEIDIDIEKDKKHSAAKPAHLALKDEFEQLWKNYPNKKGKNAAFNHYKAWRKKSVKNTNEYLEQKLADYLRYCALKKDWYHPMNGSTWFNGRFDDELDLGGVKSDPWSRHYE